MEQQEYLLELRKSHCHQADTHGGPATINTDDIVLLQEEKPRAFWKLARVKQLITGRNGKVRAAILMVPSANEQTSTFQRPRPIQLLYPLETSCKGASRDQSISSEPQSSGHQNVQITEESELPNETQVQPKREAAFKGRKRLRELDNELYMKVNIC